MQEMKQEYSIVERVPTVEEYQRLRVGVGWIEVDNEAAQASIRNSLYWICVLDGEKVVGCGRVIGDGGVCFYVQDILVLPEYQGKHLGHRIMLKIMAYIEAHVRKGSFVGLMAAAGKEDFYLRYGFIKRPAPGYGPGMFRFFK